MEFENPDHKTTHQSIERFLKELFEDPYLDPDNGHFYVGYGTTVLEIAVDPYGPEETTILVTAYCVQGAELAEDLLLGLLELNHELPVGAFSMVDGNIFFSHTIFGRSLTPTDLLGAIAAVANVADDYDDRIVKKYGGQTALDQIRDTGGRKQRSGG